MHDETCFSVYYMPYHFRVHVCVVEEGGDDGDPTRIITLQFFIKIVLYLKA